MGTSRLLHQFRRHRRVYLCPSFSTSLPSHNPNLASPYNVFSNCSCWWRLSRRSPPQPSNPNFTCFSSGLSFRSISWHAPSTGGDLENQGDVSLTEGSKTVSELSSIGLDGSEVMEAVDSESLWYAPVHAVISLLDGFHDLTCLPWWMIIFTSTLALRVSLLPVLLLQFKKVGKLSELFPKLPPPLPPPFSGRSFREQFLLFRKKRQELGCPSYLWSFAYIIVQFPCFLLSMTSIRRMSLDNHPGFDCGGTLWFQNLTEFPHGVLGAVFPILIAGLHFTNVQVSFQTFKVGNLPGVFGLLARYYKLYLDILAIPLLLVGFYIPQGSLVYWVTNSSLTLVQQLCLKNPSVRVKLGLPKEIVTTEPKISTNLHEKNVPVKHQISTENLSPQELLELSLKYLAMNHQDRALPLLRLATEKDPELVKALVAMGQILCSRGSLVEAAEYFERAILKTREDEEVGLLVLALFGAGVSHIWQGRKSEGIEYLKRIAEVKEPESHMDKACYYKGLVMLGSTLFEEGKKSEAAKYLRMAAAYDPAVNAYVKECEEG